MPLQQPLSLNRTQKQLRAAFRLRWCKPWCKLVPAPSQVLWCPHLQLKAVEFAMERSRVQLPPLHRKRARASNRKTTSTRSSGYLAAKPLGSESALVRGFLQEKLIIACAKACATFCARLWTKTDQIRPSVGRQSINGARTRSMRNLLFYPG